MFKEALTVFLVYSDKFITCIDTQNMQKLYIYICDTLTGYEYASSIGGC